MPLHIGGTSAYCLSPCNYPLHFVLSDYVDSHSRSTELMQLLSRFGIWTSRNTFQRVKTASIIHRREEGLQQEVLTGAFSVSSIDTFDSAAPGKRITSTDNHRGFHGTSFQHVAPINHCQRHLLKVRSQLIRNVQQHQQASLLLHLHNKLHAQENGYASSMRAKKLKAA